MGTGRKLEKDILKQAELAGQVSEDGPSAVFYRGESYTLYRYGKRLRVKKKGSPASFFGKFFTKAGENSRR